MKHGAQGVQFRCSGGPAQHQCMGLVSDEPSHNCSSIDFALVCRSGMLEVWESGIEQGSYGIYQSTDLLQVRVGRTGLVEYVRNDQVLYTSRAEEFSYPLAVDSSFNNPSGRLEDIEWIGPAHSMPDYQFTLDSTLSCTGCALPAVASYVGGHARWQVEAKPAGTAGQQPFYEWRNAQSPLQGTAGTAGSSGCSGIAGYASLDHWSSVWVSAIATKTGLADSDVTRSGQYRLRQIAAKPSFLPEGGTHQPHMRSITVSISSMTELASIRYSIGDTPVCGDSVGSCNGTVFNSKCGGLCSGSFEMAGQAEEFTVRAVAFRDGWANSDLATSTRYTTKRVVQTPAFTPDGGTHPANVRSITVVMSSATESAIIRYTVVRSCTGTCFSTDGGTPSSSFGTVGDSVTFEASTDYFASYVVRAVAYRDGWADSDMTSSAAFWLKRIMQPVGFTPDGGQVTEARRQIIVSFGSAASQASDEAGAPIEVSHTRFTLDGTNPSSSTGTLGNQHVFSASSSEASWIISAISFKSGWADSDVSQSGVYITRAVVAAPIYSAIK